MLRNGSRWSKMRTTITRNKKAEDVNPEKYTQR